MSHPVLGASGRRGPGGATIVAIVVVVALLLVGGFFLFSGSDDPDAPPATVIPTPGAQSGAGSDTGSDAGTSPAAPDSTATVIPEVPERTAQSRPGDEARGLIAELRAAGGRVDLHAVHVRAVRYADAGNPVDAYLLWFFAAREGHGPSAFVLGEMYDPEYFREAISAAVIGEPDPAQALKWYQRALNAGEAMADERIAALLQHVERAAAAGDADARRLLLAW